MLNIIGDLAEFGWMVVWSSRVTGEINKSIGQIGKMGCGWDGLWFSLDITEKIEWLSTDNKVRGHLNGIMVCPKSSSMIWKIS